MKKILFILFLGQSIFLFGAKEYVLPVFYDNNSGKIYGLFVYDGAVLWPGIAFNAQPAINREQVIVQTIPILQGVFKEQFNEIIDEQFIERYAETVTYRGNRVIMVPLKKFITEAVLDNNFIWIDLREVIRKGSVKKGDKQYNLFPDSALFKENLEGKLDASQFIASYITTMKGLPAQQISTAVPTQIKKPVETVAAVPVKEANVPVQHADVVSTTLNSLKIKLDQLFQLLTT